jgi:hypothetical protein
MSRVVMVGMLSVVLGCHQQAPEDTRGARGTSGRVIESNESTGRMVTPATLANGSRRELIGREMEIRIDPGRHGNDVAFWWGTAPNDVLAVIGRDSRTSDQRAAGQPAEGAMGIPTTGVVTLRGRIEPVPGAEATHSWGLTQVDARRLAEHGVYLRLHSIVQ